MTPNTSSILTLHVFVVLMGFKILYNLSFLANLVDQIRIIQQHYVYRFQKLDDVADILMQRIDSFKNLDLNLLAESNQSNFYNPKIATPSNKSVSNQTSLRSSRNNRYS